MEQDHRDDGDCAQALDFRVKTLGYVRGRHAAKKAG
jgi:hypothetical protein